MFISDRVIFLELHRTGSTHIGNILKELLGGELVGKHNQAGAELFSPGRVFLGSIRNPWEWYISLWAFGCGNKGAVFERVTKPGATFRGIGWKSNPLAALRKLLTSHPRAASQWARTYEDADDAGAFRGWLHMMHDSAHFNDLGEGYNECPLSRIAGLLTYRYIGLFCAKAGESAGMNNLSSFDELAAYERRCCFIDHFIRNENLDGDLFHALERSGIEVPASKKSDILSRSRTNVSARKHGPGYYYDGESERLVAERERLIIRKFGYVVPGMSDSGTKSS